MIIIPETESYEQGYVSETPEYGKISKWLKQKKTYADRIQKEVTQLVDDVQESLGDTDYKGFTKKEYFDYFHRLDETERALEYLGANTESVMTKSLEELRKNTQGTEMQDLVETAIHAILSHREIGDVITKLSYDVRKPLTTSFVQKVSYERSILARFMDEDEQEVLKKRIQKRMWHGGGTLAKPSSTAEKLEAPTVTQSHLDSIIEDKPQQKQKRITSPEDEYPDAPPESAIEDIPDPAEEEKPKKKNRKKKPMDVIERTVKGKN